jgi:hypothetical protein
MGIMSSIDITFKNLQFGAGKKSDANLGQGDFQ